MACVSNFQSLIIISNLVLINRFPRCSSTMKTVYWRATDPEHRFVSNISWAASMYYPMLKKFFDTFFRGDFPHQGKKIYLDHINEVKQLVPSKNLLMFNVSDGWEPLCKFLGQSIPDEPFPRSNDISSFIARSRRRNRRQMLNAALQFMVTISQMLFTGLVVYFIFKYSGLDSLRARLNEGVYSVGRIHGST